MLSENWMTPSSKVTRGKCLMSESERMMVGAPGEVDLVVEVDHLEDHEDHLHILQSEGNSPTVEVGVDLTAEDPDLEQDLHLRDQSLDLKRDRVNYCDNST